MNDVEYSLEAKDDGMFTIFEMFRLQAIHTVSFTTHLSFFTAYSTHVT